jgi:hypothetical protein
MAPVAEGFEVKLANGEIEAADSRWGARHVVARRVAFDTDPVNPRNVLPAEIYQTGPTLFGGRALLETIYTVDELST